MAMQYGRCTNMDYCTKADQREIIYIRESQPFVCPECAKPLVAATPQSATPAPPKSASPVLLAAAVALVMVGGGLVWKLFLTTPTPATRTPAVATAPPPAAPATQTAPAAPASAPVQQQAAVAPPIPPAIDPTVLLRMRGDTGMARTLGTALAAGFLSFSGDSNVTATPLANGTIAVSGMRGTGRETISVTPSTTEDGLSAITANTADIALAARAITPAETSAYARFGDLSQPAAQHIAGLDGLAVIVNPKSGVSAISIDQLRAVLDGSIKDWSDLGDASADLHLLGRAAGDHSLTPSVNGPTVAAQVMHDPLAIALVDLHDAGGAKILPVNSNGQAIAPNTLNVANGTYPLVRKYYFYTLPSSPNVLVQRFVEFSATMAGQNAVAQAGFIGNSTTPPPPPANSTTAQSALAGLRKINFVIHFNPNSTMPDMRAMRFIDSLYNILVSEHTTASKMVLVGFADSQGNETANMEVSKKRADSVAAILTARGMAPGRVEAFGSQNPIADNSTEDGRNANRRVEIYLMP